MTNIKIEEVTTAVSPEKSRKKSGTQKEKNKSPSPPEKVEETPRTSTPKEEYADFSNEVEDRDPNHNHQPRINAIVDMLAIGDLNIDYSLIFPKMEPDVPEPRPRWLREMVHLFCLIKQDANQNVLKFYTELEALFRFAFPRGYQDETFLMGVFLNAIKNQGVKKHLVTQFPSPKTYKDIKRIIEPLCSIPVSNKNSPTIMVDGVLKNNLDYEEDNLSLGLKTLMARMQEDKETILQNIL